MWRGPKSGLPQGPRWLSAGLAAYAVITGVRVVRAVRLLQHDPSTLHKVTYDQANFLVQWHLEPSSHMATIYLYDQQMT